MDKPAAQDRDSTPTGPSDAHLLRLSARDPSQFTTVYRRHVDAVLAFCASRVPEPQLAADITAETFAQALVSAGRFRPSLSPDEASARPWLMGIAKRIIWRLARSGRVEERARRRLGIQALPVTDDDIQRVDELVDLGRQRERLLRALDTLTPRLRQAVYLRVAQEQSYCEVAAALGCSTGAARARVSRALAQLAVELGDDGDPGPRRRRGATAARGPRPRRTTLSSQH